jgi:hypothetical protein
MWQSLPPLPSSAQGSTQATTRYERTSAETKPPARRSKDRVEAKQKGRSSWRGLCELSPGRTVALALALRGSVSGCLCGLESMGDGNRFPRAWWHRAVPILIGTQRPQTHQSGPAVGVCA